MAIKLNANRVNHQISFILLEYKRGRWKRNTLFGNEGWIETKWVWQPCDIYFFLVTEQLRHFRSSVLYVSSAPLSFSPIFPLRFCFFFAFYLFFLFIFVFLSITLALSCPPPHFSSLLSFIPPFSYSSLLLLLSLGTCLDKLFTFQNIISCVVFYIDRCRNSLKLNPISKFA